MPLTPADSNPMFFYDEQIRRYLLQFTRIFSNFQVEYGRDEEGTNHTLIRVPIRYGDSTRQVQTILQQNSASFMPATPLMTFYISELNYDRPRMQEPYHISKINVRQRTYDEMTNSYETTQGNAFTIERPMPVPYELTIKLDIWTSNTNQKMQILEQILVLFNPALEIQATDNFIDWTTITVLNLESTNWTSRTVPVGTDNPIDISTLTFKLPIWISSPIKVKKLGVVERIIANMYDADGDINEAMFDGDLLMGTRQVITPYNYQVLLINNTLQALREQQVVDYPNSSLQPPDSPQSNLMWPSIIGLYGVLRPGISLIKLEQEDGTEVVGTIDFDIADERFLIYNVDTSTVPSNTLAPVDAVINPQIGAPNQGLPPAAVGQRYLLTKPTGSYGEGYASAWAGENDHPLVADVNDIIEFNGTYWFMAFDHRISTQNIQYVTNITTEIQYKWTGEVWVKSYQGLYPGGKWRLVL